MYCRNCGAQIPDESKICPECGTEQIVTVRIEQPQKEVDAPNTGLAVLCFFLSDNRADFVARMEGSIPA